MATNNNIFSNDPIEENDQQDTTLTFEDLVGEGKKYANADELAKAYANADGFIQMTKAEKAQLEAENKVLKDLAEKPKKQADPSGDEPDPSANKPDEGGNEDNKRDLTELIAEQMEARDKEKTFTSNVNAVSEKLANHFGGAREAQKRIEAKAKELNVGVDWLMDVAGKSPAAFYNTLGLDARSISSPNSSSGGDVNTAALGGGPKKNFKYFEEIRKNDPKLYFSPAVQKELYKSARELGEKFYV